MHFSRSEQWLVLILAAVVTAGTGVRWVLAAWQRPVGLVAVAQAKAAPAGTAPGEKESLGKEGVAQSVAAQAVSDNVSLAGTSFAPKADAAPAAPEAAAAATGAVDLNQAGFAELVELPGIGPALAERILAHRRLHGPLGDIAALLEVKGIGPATLQRLAGKVKVTGGAASAAGGGPPQAEAAATAGLPAPADPPGSEKACDARP